ncbi:hypothetical protein J421_5105 (plasmid) [Gemmatirosa kalamazoonensis]|uniref:Methyltransferase domain-containing protein n=1 Tax=Gemmatirosa kalamazoonensis TaxID=861299 RepID=W0RQM4_9BACT|nr:class I SAM-dependent methyltransferase [Gemmatirosa kalamazoonensis]AHG92640.1 hypothetical protein J421_5105 [Gemmatirosa kalamazoonensis]
MSDCCDCYTSKFDDARAADDLARYHREGPNDTTRRLLDVLRAEGVEGATLLDIGGGVGVVQHELLGGGVREAVAVDASRAYLSVARREAEQRGTAQRSTFLLGDFVALAPEIAPADVVTLDRVICCYGDMESLVAASASRARRLYGFVVLRDTWWVRAREAFDNLARRLRGVAFRSYVHSLDAIDAAVRRQGLRPRYSARTLVWEIAVYER